MRCLGLTADLSLDPARTITDPIPHLARAVVNLSQHRADLAVNSLEA